MSLNGLSGSIAVHEMRHDAAQSDRLVGDRALQRGQHRRIVGLVDTVAIQAGVYLDGDGRVAPRALDRVEQFGELAHRRHRDLDVGLQCGREVGARRVQPCQHGCGDAVSAQCQRLVDGGDAEFRRARGQGRAADLGGAVAVPVGLHDSHHLRRPGMLAQQPDIVRDGVEVHHRLGGVGRLRRRGGRELC